MIDSVRQLLWNAGWRPDRQDCKAVAEWREKIDGPGGFEMSEAARQALAEFGGIKIEVRGRGIDFAKTSVHIDPTLAIGEESRFEVFGKQLGSRLYPLGEAGDGHAFLAIDGRGMVYLVMDDAIKRVGRSMAEAIESLVLGREMA